MKKLKPEEPKSIKEKLKDSIDTIKEASIGNRADIRNYTFDLEVFINDNMDYKDAKKGGKIITKIIDCLGSDMVTDAVDEANNQIENLPIPELIAEIEDSPEELIGIFNDQLIFMPNNIRMFEVLDIVSETEIDEYMEIKKLNNQIRIIN